MRIQNRGASRRDQYGSRINRQHSMILAIGIPYSSILLGSILPNLFIASAVPIIPPLGLMMLVAWRLVRPGILPIWVGFPLGLLDDLLSGHPFGNAILLWSLAMIAIEAIELRFPWRGFLQDWLTAALVLAGYLFAAMLLSGGKISGPVVLGLIPQYLLCVLLFPIISRMVARLDRLRLMRFKAI